MTTITGGVDLGGTKIQAVVLRDREVIGSARTLTPTEGPAEVASAICATLKAAASSAGLSSSDLAAVGIGAPGEIDADEGVVSRSPNVNGFQEPVELGPMVSRGLGDLPVRLDNDVRVAVTGEHQRGAGRPFRDLLGVFVGTGVGGGLILDGKLRIGAGAAGEIGHTTVKDGGRECGCGQRGHLEAYAGRARMEHAAREMQKKGHETILFDLMKKKGRSTLSSGVFQDALNKKDKVAHRLIDEAVWALGIALASAQNLLQFEAIVIGGGLGDRLGSPFIDRVRDAVTPRLHVAERPPAILGTELRDLSGAVGAAIIAEQSQTT
jgi:glucokinase